MTIDHTRLPKGSKKTGGRGTLPQFAPVPRLCNRHDGWTPERQSGFIEALADLGSVKAAAHAVNMAPEGAYQLRRHPEAGEFRKAWEAALACGVQKIEDVAMDRALNGVEVPIYHFGQVVGTRTVYNDYLLMFLLRNRAPKRFGADSSARGMSAVDNMRLKRLKKAWYKEWEDERRAKRPSREQMSESILRRLEALDLDERTRWTPREHELHQALDAERAERHAREEEEARQRFIDMNPQIDWSKREHAQYLPAQAEAEGGEIDGVS